jgi:hypothetical protein
MMANGRIRPLWPVLISIFLALLVTGCSNSSENTGLSLVDQNGDHPASFLSTHPGFAVADVNQCRPCHGDDLTGGISNQSCFLSACHHDPEPNWVAAPPAPQPHGSSAKASPSNGEGYPACQICHAVDFSGGGAQVPCLNASCHGGPGTTPHPSQWRSVDTYVHTNTNEGNASVCAQCHLAGNNSPIGPPSPPATAGTPPGCFNSTLCHGADTTPHPLGATWTAPNPSFHGLTAKADLAFCQTCHGTGTTAPANFGGGTSGTSCYTCHTVSAPHPSGATWVNSTSPTHRTTNSANAPVCAQCHQSSAGTPGCFNSTLCH